MARGRSERHDLRRVVALLVTFGIPIATACELAVDTSGLTGGIADAGSSDGKSGDASSAIDGGHSGDGSVSDAGADSPVTEAGSFAIACDPQPCTAPSCCRPTNGGEPYCAPTCGTSEVTVSCDDMTDCKGGGRCCGSRVSGALVSAGCTIAPTCPTGDHVTLCNANNTGECPDGSTCGPASAFIPYPYCQ